MLAFKEWRHSTGALSGSRKNKVRWMWWCTLTPTADGLSSPCSAWLAPALLLTDTGAAGSLRHVRQQLCSCFNCFIRIGVLCAYAANQNLSSQVKNVRRLVNSNMRDLHTFANDTPMVRQKVSIWNTMLHKELGWSIIDGSVKNFPYISGWQTRGYTCESVCISFLFSLLKLGFLVMLTLCNPFTWEKRIFSTFVHATPAKLLLKRLFSYGEISPTISLTLVGGICWRKLQPDSQVDQ